MEYFTEQGSTHREAIERVRAKYGDAAQILTQRAVRAGGVLGLFARERVELTGYIRQDSAKEAANRRPDIEEDKRKLLATIQDRTLQEVLSEVRELKQAMETYRPPEAEADHPNLKAMDDLLALNEFTESYRRGTLDRIRSEVTLEGLEDWDALQDAVLDWIASSIEISPPSPRTGSRVFVLVGPTGVGKTTTVAKLAAIHRIGIGGLAPHDVRMVTIDSYRIGARQQIETYGGIMGVPTSCVETAEDLAKTLAMYAGVDLVLVDTIGKSPREAVKLAEMKQILEACGPRAEVHLAVAATTKTTDMEETLRQFEPFNYQAVLVTKLDETNRLGNVISVLSRGRKP
ncbi:MAG TPA: flagellar biosynthesis protein FlhF, partial [Magnetospirillaceae bacterium]|nr:flagellar biosynthesis protein FlhF [Magnetospirillaceae bacterium]